MHYYKIKIMKTSGYLNESAGKAPKVLYVESKEALSERQALIRASKKYKGMYGAEIRIADVEQISEGVWDAVKGIGSGIVGAGKQAVNNVKNAYVNNRNASRINSIIKNVVNVINSKIAPEIQKSAKFGGFTQEQLQQIQSAMDNVMNTATPAQEEGQQQQQQQQQQQPQQAQTQQQQGAKMNLNGGNVATYNNTPVATSGSGNQ